MKNDEAKIIINKVLIQMGATDIAFQDTKNSNLIAVVFNCKEVTSFVTDIPGWTYSGIRLDPSGSHQYRIDFAKAT